VAEYDVPDDLRYSTEHEWARVEGRRVTVGVTDYAQQQLGDIVFVELPEVGSTIEQGSSLGVIESVKAVSDVYSPISGKVVEINAELEDHPEYVNEDCYGDGWILAVRLDDASELDELLAPEAYRKHLDELSD
jgi:glycine cleavage system H protein